MRKTICLEVKNSICNWRFWIGSLIIVCVAIIATRDQIQQLLTLGQSQEGPGWFVIFQFFANHPSTLMFISLLSPFALGAEAEEELRSRFALFACVRSGRKRYFAGKIFALLFSGGFMICVVMLFFLIIAGVGFHDIIWPGETDQRIQTFYITLFFYFTRGFLNGAFWALIGGLAAIVARNCYMAYAVPFVLYYVLSVFQERYYRSLLYLNPKYWATPLYYGDLPGIGILLILLQTTAIVFGVVMKKRLLQ